MLVQYTLGFNLVKVIYIPIHFGCSPSFFVLNRASLEKSSASSFAAADMMSTTKPTPDKSKHSKRHGSSDALSH